MADTAAGPAGVTTRELLRGTVDMVLRIHRGGGLVISGTDSPLDNIAVSLHATCARWLRGLTPYEALTTATRNPAKWLNLEDRIGVIKPGAQADLSFVDGDPLADIRVAAAVDRVMVASRIHTVDELLAPYPAATQAQPAVHAANAPQPLTREQAHAHDDKFWWHEPGAAQSVLRGLMMP